MTRQDLKKFAIPRSPGVYFFMQQRKKGKKILYIGKATSLSERIRSYFGKDLLGSRGPAMVNMLENASSVRAIKTDSVLEALLLESKLIKKHKPPFNVEGKDDKSFQDRKSVV